MSEKILNDILFENMFSQAVKENFEQSLNEILSEQELDKTISLSEFHEARMKKLFSKTIRQERVHSFMKWSGQAAAVLAVAVAILFGILMMTYDVRAVVYVTVVHWADDITHFGTPDGRNEPAAMEPQNIPHGFSETARTTAEDVLSIIYMDKTGAIILFNAIPISGMVSVTNTNMAYEQTRIENVDYHVFNSQDEKQHSVVWEIEGFRYYLSAYLPVETLLDIAQRIK